MLRGLDQESAAALIKKAMTAAVDDAVWFSFIETIDLNTQNEYGGTRFAYRAGLGTPPAKIEKAQIIHLDLGTGDSKENFFCCLWYSPQWLKDLLEISGHPKLGDKGSRSLRLANLTRSAWDIGQREQFR